MWNADRGEREREEEGGRERGREGGEWFLHFGWDGSVGGRRHLSVGNRN